MSFYINAECLCLKNIFSMLPTNKISQIKFYILLTVLLYSGNSHSQNVPIQYDFDSTLTNKTDSIFIYVKNPTTQVLFINSVRTLTPQFYTNINTLNINPFDSVLIWIYFRSNQNITYNDFIIFESEILNYSIVNYLTATSVYPDTLYRFTQGLTDEPLKNALKNFCSTNTNNNYTSSRLAMFSTIDDYDMNDTIECVYTGRKVYTTGIPSVNPPQSMNTEHTFPQGFFNQSEPMRSDIHHLFPSDEEANSRRANLDFGYVLSNITWQNGGSKLGNDSEGQLVFEVRNLHKGNVARCLFYFLMRYQNYGTFMDAKQERVLREWSLIDTVNTRERIRNNGIHNFQNNRSPFVDHPELIDRLRSTYSIIPDIPRPKISASPFQITFDTIAVNDTANYFLSLFNFGSGNLNINSITSSSPQITVENIPVSIEQNNFQYARIKFRPNQTNQTFTSILNIDNSDSTIHINVVGYSNKTIGITTISEQLPVKYSLSQNYPNPFNPNTNLEFGISKWGFASLKIYDISGKEVATLVNSNLKPGKYRYNFDASALSSGLYFYKLQTDNFLETKMMTLIK